MKWREAPLYVASEELITSLDLALDLNMPLLITGPPGSGKTAAAYWAAWKLGLTHEQVIHEPIRSTSTSDSLKYRFDSVGYFRESQVSAQQRISAIGQSSPVRLTAATSAGTEPTSELRHRDFILPGALWRAYEASEKAPVVLLLDEIDKASRDLPNDVLFELEEERFSVPELALDDPNKRVVERRRGLHPLLCIITSNGERDLPSPFLRRCLHHYVKLQSEQIAAILLQRTNLGLSEPLLELAQARFKEIQSRRLEHTPDLAEFLIWLTALKRADKLDENALKTLPLAKVDYLGALVKTPGDIARLGRSG